MLQVSEIARLLREDVMHAANGLKRGTGHRN
jgi:hypothetical protein